MEEVTDGSANRQMDIIRLLAALLILKKMQTKRVVKAFFLTRKINKMCQEKKMSSKRVKEEVYTTKIHSNCVNYGWKLLECMQSVSKQMCRSAVTTKTGVFADLHREIEVFYFQ